ncbi:MAG: S-methyl-5-thioribose-1-phosphate isomerase [Promethearchaeota archaeon]|nr:MAG: S-methyl-5-thioribose-1-phosphate isomerase [Candidatus Lokiarchaeota archaeon]
MIPTIEWLVDKRCVQLIDQTQLPHKLIHEQVTTHAHMALIIKDMHIRGAPAIGVAAAFGMVLAAQEFQSLSFPDFIQRLQEAALTLRQTRPTAVNLFWAVDRMLQLLPLSKTDVTLIPDLLLTEAMKMWEEDIITNKNIGKYGASILDDGDTVLTHCNAGSLATVLYGTALAPIRWAIEEQKKKISVIADETRPRLQGARLTAWELQYDNIPVEIESDNTAGLMMRLGKIQKIIVGADRIVSDAVFNKIGTYMIAITAQYHNIPFYVAAPRSTLSLLESEKDVIIEQRDGDFEGAHVVGFAKDRICPEGVRFINYAFDATPMELITGIITEDGIFSPSELLQKYS